MAYNAVPTVSTDDTWSADQHNTYIKDNFAYFNTLTRDGWVNPGETWTYSASNAFTITGDKTAYYSIGDKIKLTQTTVKYFYITKVAFYATDTMITITGGSDYTLTEADITDNYHSKSENPAEFPKFFNFTTTPNGWAGTPTVTYSFFDIKGGICNYYVRITGTSNATTASTKMPIGIDPDNPDQISPCFVTDNGTEQFIPGKCYVTVGVGLGWLHFSKGVTGGAFTNSGTKTITATFSYRFNQG